MDHYNFIELYTTSASKISGKHCCCLKKFTKSFTKVTLCVNYTKEQRSNCYLGKRGRAVRIPRSWETFWWLTSE